ncbi:MAG: membrane fusion protein [Flavobacteriaceae bacterium]|jgi:membrane fusion protein
MLFRQQVVEKRQKRLYGTVIISTPLAFSAVAAVMVGILGGAIAFASVSSFARVEPVRGVIVPSGGVATVRASSGGILNGFSLSEGDTVTAEQNLGQITIDGAITGEGTRLEAELSRINTQIENLEQQQHQTLAIAGIDLVALSHQEDRVRDRIARLHHSLDLRRAAADETRAVFNRIVVLADRDLASERQLSMERLQVIAADQQVVEMENEFAELSSDLREFTNRHQETVARKELTVLQIEVDLDNLVAERSVLSSNQSFAVTAPVDGRVSAVTARNGHQVRQGETMFSILPIERSLQAELYVPSRAIGFVQPGLSVRVLLDAFPYQRFGTMSGEVLEVTTTVLETGIRGSRVPTNEPVFRAIVGLESDLIDTQGREHPLQVGMTLTGNIVLDERTILSRVIDPLISLLRQH